MCYAMAANVFTSAAVKKRENQRAEWKMLCDSCALWQTKQKAQQRCCRKVKPNDVKVVLKNSSVNSDELFSVADETSVYLPLNASQSNNDKSGGCLLMISRDCFSSLVKATFKSYIYRSICMFCECV